MIKTNKKKPNISVNVLGVTNHVSVNALICKLQSYFLYNSPTAIFVCRHGAQTLLVRCLSPALSISVPGLCTCVCLCLSLCPCAIAVLQFCWKNHCLEESKYNVFMFVFQPKGKSLKAITLVVG